MTETTVKPIVTNSPASISELANKSRKYKNYFSQLASLGVKSDAGIKQAVSTISFIGHMIQKEAVLRTGAELDQIKNEANLLRQASQTIVHIRSDKAKAIESINDTTQKILSKADSNSDKAKTPLLNMGAAVIDKMPNISSNSAHVLSEASKALDKSPLSQGAEGAASSPLSLSKQAVELAKLIESHTDSEGFLNSKTFLADLKSPNQMIKVRNQEGVQTVSIYDAQFIKSTINGLKNPAILAQAETKHQLQKSLISLTNITSENFTHSGSPNFQNAHKDLKAEGTVVLNKKIAEFNKEIAKGNFTEDQAHELGLDFLAGLNKEEQSLIHHIKTKMDKNIDTGAILDKGMKIGTAMITSTVIAVVGSVLLSGMGVPMVLALPALFGIGAKTVFDDIIDNKDKRAGMNLAEQLTRSIAKHLNIEGESPSEVAINAATEKARELVGDVAGDKVKEALETVANAAQEKLEEVKSST